MKRIFVFLSVLTLFGLFFLNEHQVEASSSVSYQVTGIFDTGGSMPVQSGTLNRGFTLSLDVSEVTSGHTFAFWIVNGVVNKNLGVDHVFQMTSDMTLEAVFVPESKSVVIFVDSNGVYINHAYTTGGAVSEPSLAGVASRPGFVFASEKWTSIEGSESLDEIEVSSVFVLTYQEALVPLNEVDIDVQNGSLSLSSPVSFNTLVTATADGAPFGQVFAGWVENGKIVSYESSYQFTALYDRELTATYASSVSPVPLVTLSSALNYRDDYDSYVGQYEIPEGYTLIEYGFIFHASLTGPITFDTAGKVVAQATNRQAVTKEFVMSFDELSYTAMRSYIIVKNDTDMFVVYNDTPMGIRQGSSTFINYNGEGDADDTYTDTVLNAGYVDIPITYISTPAQFVTLVSARHSANPPTVAYVLANDIDLTGYTLTPGTDVNNRTILDGNGYTVSNITYSTTAAALFGRMPGAVVRNINFTNVTFTTTNVAVGFLRTDNGGKIENVYVEGSFKTVVGTQSARPIQLAGSGKIFNSVIVLNASGVTTFNSAILNEGSTSGITDVFVISSEVTALASKPANPITNSGVYTNKNLFLFGANLSSYSNSIWNFPVKKNPF
jgi:hypothetical protein